MNDEDVWFEPKRFGYGSGLPVSWQGWAVLIGYIAAICVVRLLLPGHWLIHVVAILLLTAVLLVLCARHTRGGWRWRRGEDS